MPLIATSIELLRGRRGQIGEERAFALAATDTEAGRTAPAE